MESPLLRLLISSRSVNKHGHHKQFLFLIGLFLKVFSSETSGFRGKAVLESTNKKQELPVAAIFVNGLGRHEQSL
jgi:hypothetical protein